MIINEPDYWTVNLVAKTAQHGVDPGPTFNCHLPIFAYGSPQSLDEETKEIRGLEFGQELEFFESKGAVPEPGPVLFNHETSRYTVQVGTAALTLFLAKSWELPIAVSLKRGDKNDIFLYSQYARMEFDPKLFAKPDVKIEGSKPWFQEWLAKYLDYTWDPISRGRRLPVEKYAIPRSWAMPIRDAPLEELSSQNSIP